MRYFKSERHKEKRIKIKNELFNKIEQLRKNQKKSFNLIINELIEQALHSIEKNTSSPGENSETPNIRYKDADIIIYQNDFLKVNIDEFKGSIDLIITSPPYNLDINYGTHNDNLDYKEYLEFTETWLSKALQLLKEDGRICLNIPLDKNKNGQQAIYADIVNIAKKVGFKYQSTIVWNEQNISRRTAWGSWLSASAPYVIAPVEMIVVMYKSSWKKLRKGTSTITKEEFIEWTNGVWTFSGESKKRVGHPAPFPIELPRRCIKLFSYKEDIILDPFLGSGTTLIAAKLEGRKGVGIEINPAYVSLAIKRLQNLQPIPQLPLK